MILFLFYLAVGYCISLHLLITRKVTIDDFGWLFFVLVGIPILGMPLFIVAGISEVLSKYSMDLKFWNKDLFKK